MKFFRNSLSLAAILLSINGSQAQNVVTDWNTIASTTIVASALIYAFQSPSSCALMLANPSNSSLRVKRSLAVSSPVVHWEQGGTSEWLPRNHSFQPRFKTFQNVLHSVTECDGSEDARPGR